MTLVPKVDESSCIAQGDCAELAPDVFQVDDCARIVGGGPDELVLEAARGCPTEAISVIDSQTGEQVYP